MGEDGEASDDGQLFRISTGRLPSAVPMIIDLKMIGRASCTALALRAMAIRSQHALTKVCNSRMYSG